MRIRKLPEAVVARIAAGEVVENPASVVRELVENALDAGATEIQIWIEEGGKRRIRVQDNGIGMTPEEIPLAVQRFTTSKIQEPEDLNRVATLGFRGEALYAIASVARLTIVSRPREAEEGWRVEFEKTRVVRQEPAAHPPGTTVEVRDLFYDFPARRHFLSPDYVETRRIIELVGTYALAHPKVAFTLTVDGQEVYRLEPADRAARIRQIYGEEWLQDALEVHRTYPSGVEVYGFVSRPDKLKSRPLVQVLLVNGRWIQDDRLRAAVHRAYDTAVHYPEFVLYLTVPPEAVDFNIHPAKQQARFARRLRIFEKILKAVGAALRSQMEQTLRPKLKLVSYPPAPPPHRPLEIGEGSLFHGPSAPATTGTPEAPASQPPASAEGRNAPPTAVPLFQVDNTYIVARVESGLVIVDQHVAHERVLYERLKNREVNVRLLLFPIVLDLTPAQRRWVEQNLEALKKAGFVVELLSGNSISLKGIPDILEEITKESFLAILEEVQRQKRLPDVTLGLLKTLACKAAVKAGDPLSPEEMQSLLEQLFATENPYFCPHGRPILIVLSREELERRFGRR